MTKQYIECDSDEHDFLDLEIEDDTLFVGISDGGNLSFMSIKSRAKIQELIDSLTKAKKELSR